MKILAICGLILCSIFGVLFLHDRNENRYESVHFSRGDSRAVFYEKMGKPHNSDDAVVAIWFSDASTKKDWRTMISDGTDPYIAIFDNQGNALNHKRSRSQMALYPEISDEAIQAKYKENADNE